MQNTKVLEMINNGQIEELKAQLQDEIYKDSLKGNTSAKKRYTAMKKYLTYIEDKWNEKLVKPCVIDYEGNKYTSFLNGKSFALTTESAGEIELYNENDYYDMGKMLVFDGRKRVIDFTKVIAEAKAKGYKLKKSEVETRNDFKYVMHYDGAYYKVGLLDATYSIIDNGQKAEVWHKDGSKISPIIIKNDVGICLVLPIVVFDTNDPKCEGITVIEAEVE